MAKFESQRDKTLANFEPLAKIGPLTDGDFGCIGALSLKIAEVMAPIGAHVGGAGLEGMVPTPLAWP